MKKIVLVVIFTFLSAGVFAKSGKPVKLWKNVPGMEKCGAVMYMHSAFENSEGEDGNQTSSGEGCDSENSLHPAVIICPGGSYHHLGLYGEGYKSAQWFSSKGFVAYTLRYRTAENGHHYPAMFQDLQRAIQLVRENAEEYGVDVNRVGVIGYSAGGHLVTMAGAFAESHDELKKLGIEHEVSLRPDFVIPVYPVVSMNDEIGHRWSRKSLLGDNQSEERKNEFSMELQIPDTMPPTYVVVCKDDPVVDYRNSYALHDALTARNIPGGFAVYDWGKHGFGMLNNRFMKTFHWNDRMWEEFLEPIVMQ